MHSIGVERCWSYGTASAAAAGYRFHSGMVRATNDQWSCNCSHGSKFEVLVCFCSTVCRHHSEFFRRHRRVIMGYSPVAIPICSIVNLVAVSSVLFFDMEVIIWVYRWFLAWLPERQLWGTLGICINPTWLLWTPGCEKKFPEEFRPSHYLVW